MSEGQVWGACDGRFVVMTSFEMLLARLGVHWHHPSTTRCLQVIRVLFRNVFVLAGHIFPDAGCRWVFTASSGCYGSFCVCVPFHGVDWVPDQGQYIHEHLWYQKCS